MWYAVNRLGYNTCVCHCWGVGLDVPVEYLFVTRVMEKPGLLSAAIMLELLEVCWGDALRQGLVDVLNVWSDCGPHYRNMTMLSLMAYTIPTKYRINTQWSFGLESHLKGIPDGVTGQLERIRKGASHGKLINTLEGLKAVYDEASDVRLSDFPHGVPLKTVLFVPPAKDTLRSSLRPVDPSSLPMRLGDSHSWSWTINDYRKKSFLGKGTNAFTCTGITCRAHRLPGMKATADQTAFCKLVDPAAVAAAAAIKAAKVAAAKAAAAGEGGQAADATAAISGAQETAGGAAEAAGSAGGGGKQASGAAATALAEPEEEEGVGAEPGEEPGEMDILLSESTREYQGWKISYRKGAYEDEFTAWLSVLRRARIRPRSECTLECVPAAT